MPLGKGAMQSTAMGQLGADFINDTETHTGDWGVLYCLASCSFTLLASGELPNGDDAVVATTGDLTGITLTPGMLIYGRYAQIKLASGKLMAYRL